MCSFLQKKKETHTQKKSSDSLISWRVCYGEAWLLGGANSRLTSPTLLYPEIASAASTTKQHLLEKGDCKGIQMESEDYYRGKKQ